MYIEPCTYRGYEHKSLIYDASGQMAYNVINYQKQFLNLTTQSAATLLIGYATTNIAISEDAQLIDIYSFISSIGGNLGLFVGFSFLAFLFQTYEWIGSIISKSE